MYYPATMETIDEAVGHAVRERRQKKGQSLECVARATNQTKSALSRLECGRRSWSVSQLVGVAGALGLDPGRLLTRARSALREPDNPDT